MKIRHKNTSYVTCGHRKPQQTHLLTVCDVRDNLLSNTVLSPVIIYLYSGVSFSITTKHNVDFHCQNLTHKSLNFCIIINQHEIRHTNGARYIELLKY